MKFIEKNWMLLVASAVIAAGVVYASNNVSSVEDVIG